MLVSDLLNFVSVLLHSSEFLTLQVLQRRLARFNTSPYRIRGSGVPVVELHENLHLTDAVAKIVVAKTVSQKSAQNLSECKQFCSTRYYRAWMLHPRGLQCSPFIPEVWDV